MVSADRPRGTEILVICEIVRVSTALANTTCEVRVLFWYRDEADPITDTRPQDWQAVLVRDTHKGMETRQHCQAVKPFLPF